MNEPASKSAVWRWVRRIVLWVAILGASVVILVLLFVWLVFFPSGGGPDPKVISRVDIQGYRFTAEKVPALHITTDGCTRVFVTDTLGHNKRFLMISDIGDSAQFTQLNELSVKIVLFWNQIVGPDTYEFRPIDSLIVDLDHVPDTIHRFEFPPPPKESRNGNRPR